MRVKPGTIIGFAVYYIVCAAIAIWATVAGLSLQLPAIVLFVILLFACVGGGKNHRTELLYHEGAPLIASEEPGEPETAARGLPLLFSVLLLLPPVAYLVFYHLAWQALTA